MAVKDVKELWSFKMRKVVQESMTGDDCCNVHDKPSCAPVIGSDSLIYVATDGGSVYVLKGGKEKWSSFTLSLLSSPGLIWGNWQGEASYISGSM